MDTRRRLIVLLLLTALALTACPPPGDKPAGDRDPARRNRQARWTNRQGADDHGHRGRVRLVILDAQIEHTYTRGEWQTADPATVVNRIERQLQRLPETLVSTRAEGDAARAKGFRAEARIGQPWEHTAELARLSPRQQEIDEALAATVEPATPDAVPTPDQVTPGDPLDAATARVRQHLDALGSGNPEFRVNAGGPAPLGSHR